MDHLTNRQAPWPICVAWAVWPRRSRSGCGGRRSSTSPGRQFEFIFTEVGLLRRPGSAGLQRAQLAHLGALVGSASVTFRVIALDVEIRANHGCGFVL